MIGVEKKIIEDSADHQNSDTRGNLLTAVMRASYSEEKKDIPTMSGAQNRKPALQRMRLWEIYLSQVWL